MQPGRRIFSAAGGESEVTPPARHLYDKREATYLAISLVWSLIIAISPFTIPDYNPGAPDGHWTTIFRGLGTGASLLMAIPLAVTLLVGVLLNNSSSLSKIVALILASIMAVCAVFGSLFGWPAAAIPAGLLLIASCVHRLRRVRELPRLSAQN